ncbi:MAG: ester cyclase [Actinomycetota bacterium]|nr:ester cyclase [Actinomycetota bacterium]
MSTAQNKELARRLYEEVLNKGDLDAIDDMFVEEYDEHDPLPGQGTGRQGARDRFTALKTGMDPHFTLEDIIAEGDKVVVRWTNNGTNVGEFAGMPATGRSYSIAGIDIYRVQDGKFAEHWHVVDMLGHMVQLGFISPPGGQKA